MLLYVTVDDVLGGTDGDGPGPDPRLPAPATLAALYDRAMRRHARRAALVHFEQERPESLPDWRLDRLVIRVALYCRERLQLEPGERVAVLGPPGWLWPVAESAALGFGGVALGLEHELPDAELERALRDAAPRVAFGTDAPSAARLLRLRRACGFPESVVGPGCADEPGAHGLAQALELGATLDTPERAQNFRACARSLDPQAGALWHTAADGSFTRLTHAAALERLAARLAGVPAAPDALGCVAPRRMTLAARLACHAFLGSGRVTLVLVPEERLARELPGLRPHALFASAAWSEGLWRGVAGASPGWRRALAERWPASAGLRRFDRRGASVRRALAGRVGERLAWLELEDAPAAEAATALREAGLELRREDGAAEDRRAPGPGAPREEETCRAGA